MPSLSLVAHHPQAYQDTKGDVLTLCHARLHGFGGVVPLPKCRPLSQEGLLGLFRVKLELP